MPEEVKGKMEESEIRQQAEKRARRRLVSFKEQVKSPWLWARTLWLLIAFLAISVLARFWFPVGLVMVAIALIGSFWLVGREHRRWIGKKYAEFFEEELARLEQKGSLK